MADEFEVIFVGAVATVLGVVLLLKGVRAMAQDKLGRGWPSAPGRVTNSQITLGKDSRLLVEYRYEVDGVSYEGDVLQAREPTRSLADNEALWEQHPVGEEVTVYYDPANPSKAVLLLGTHSAHVRVMLASSLVMLLCGLLTMASAIPREVAEPSNPAASQAVTTISGLHAPMGIAISRRGTVYLCDGGSTAPMPGSQSHPSGRVLRAGDSRDLTGGTLNLPVGLAFGAGTIYVTDHDPASNSGRLWVFTLGETDDRSDIMVNGVKPLAQLHSPGGVAVDSTGSVYVAEPVSGRVLRFGPRATSGTEFFKSPDDGSLTDVAVDSADNVFVSDSRRSRLWKIPTHGDTSPKQVAAEFWVQPQGLTVDAAGNLYVADSGNHRVLKFAPDLNEGTEVPFDHLDNPYGVAVDGRGQVYVTDNGTGRVLMSSPDHS
jgi:sugar lactone lactonase YvrE